MKIGISVCSLHFVDDPRTGARHMIERTASAREAGLDSLFVGDHHVTASPYYQNNVILPRMLAEWGGKPFGALYLLPLWHPVLLAEQIGTLASLSEGPFIMQCGLGDEPQGVRMGIDLSKRVGMFTASLNVLRQLWAGESVSEGRYWGIDPEALLIGSIAQVSEQLSTLQMLGYTDVIVRNISQDQSQCLASIERLSEVRDQL